MAISQLILVPLVLRRYHFSTYCKIFIPIVIMLVAVGLFLTVWKWKKIKEVCRRQNSNEHLNVWTLLFMIGAFFCVFAQAYLCSSYQHLDEDDSRFVVEQVVAVENDSMYTQNLVTGKISYWDMGQVRKDMVSPWAMFLAIFAKISRIAPAILCHKYLPFFFLFLCYAIYTLIAMNLLKDNLEKTAIFIILASTINLFGYFSTHTPAAVLLLRLWQGKAFVGGVMIPMIFFSMLEILDNKQGRIWYLFAAIVSCAAALASGTGIITIPIVIGCFSFVSLIHERKWNRMLGIVSTAIPSGVYLLVYLFFWQLLKVYY